MGIAVQAIQRAGPVTIIQTAPAAWLDVVRMARQDEHRAAAVVKPLEDLHPRQLDALRFIGYYRRTVGVPPQLREIMQAIGVTSTSVMKHHVVALTKAGYVTLLPSISRGIVLSPAGERACSEVSR